jgi:hypothetical protein
MTKGQIEACARKWQERLNLQHWELTFDFETPPEDDSVAAAIRTSPDYHRSELRFASSWPDWTAELAGAAAASDEYLPDQSLDRTIAHELVHLLLHDVDELPKLIEDELAPAAERLYCRAHDTALERAVEEIARAFCQAYGEG